MQPTVRHGENMMPAALSETHTNTQNIKARQMVD